MLQQLLNDESSIRVAVVRFLARREYSRYELCERLKLRVASLTELDNVLADLQNQGLIHLRWESLFGAKREESLRSE